MWHNEPENPLDESGYTKCSVCGAKRFIADVDTCEECNNWVCKTGCASYRRQVPYGYICKKCQGK